MNEQQTPDDLSNVVQFRQHPSQIEMINGRETDIAALTTEQLMVLGLQCQRRLGRVWQEWHIVQEALLRRTHGVYTLHPDDDGGGAA